MIPHEYTVAAELSVMRFSVPSRFQKQLEMFSSPLSSENSVRPCCSRTGRSDRTINYSSVSFSLFFSRLRKFSGTERFIGPCLPALAASKSGKIGAIFLPFSDESRESPIELRQKSRRQPLAAQSAGDVDRAPPCSGTGSVLRPRGVRPVRTPPWPPTDGERRAWRAWRPFSAAEVRCEMIAATVLRQSSGHGPARGIDPQDER